MNMTLRYSGVEMSPAAALFTLLFILALIVVGIIIWFKVAKNMARIAADKGYTERRWFHYCFWLGLAGMLMVCAMPDKNRRG